MTTTEIRIQELAELGLYADRRIADLMRKEISDACR
jgi:hypothetical protein